MLMIYTHGYHSFIMLDVLCHSDLCTELLISLRSLAASLVQKYVYISGSVDLCEWHSISEYTSMYK